MPDISPDWMWDEVDKQLSQSDIAKLANELRPYGEKSVGSIRICVREVAKIVAALDRIKALEAQLAASDGLAEVEPTAWAYDRTDHPLESMNGLQLSYQDPTQSMLDGDKGITNIRPLYALEEPQEASK